MKNSARSVYLKRLRRAFLLRVHPDRYSCHRSNQQIRQQQALLVKALENRFQCADFVQWQTQTQQTQQADLFPNHHQYHKHDPYPYVMETRKGTLLKSDLSLNGSVTDILQAIRHSLIQAGVASIPDLPPPPQTQQPDVALQEQQEWLRRVQQEFSPSSSSRRMDDDSRGGPVAWRRKDRDLGPFLDHLMTTNLRSDILQRKQSRLDAQAAAQQVRQLYKFSAVDALETGWSSECVTILFRKLLELHHEFHQQQRRIHVDNFYPIRLVFSHENYFQQDDALDVYGGGTLRLKPACTPIEWLEKLQLVTMDKIEDIRHYRTLLHSRTQYLQGTLGVKIRKGFTCSSREYHEFVERLTADAYDDDKGSAAHWADEGSSTVPMLEPVHAVIESDAVCRKPLVTSAGQIRLSSRMDLTTCVAAIAKLAPTAREKTTLEKLEQKRNSESIRIVQYNLGLQKVYRNGPGVSHEQFRNSLSRLLLLQQQQQQATYNHHHARSTTTPQQQQQQLSVLSGNSLGIAATGHFCHLADDGSLVIPHDWV